MSKPARKFPPTVTLAELVTPEEARDIEYANNRRRTGNFDLRKIKETLRKNPGAVVNPDGSIKEWRKEAIDRLARQALARHAVNKAKRRG